MTWHDVVAYFFGGMFLANFTPHFIAGVSGRPFYTPFAKPPFRGLSPPAVNILYGLFNLGVAYVLLVVVGSFELRLVADAAISAMGFGLWSLFIARSVTKLLSTASCPQQG
ncbi:MAG TPA: hypothetical protein VKU41_10935 [Polyangiaceae bacterium]|nr:hypothetical protein [Polyangiaceae bacterium]